MRAFASWRLKSPRRRRCWCSAPSARAQGAGAPPAGDRRARAQHLLQARRQRAGAAHGPDDQVHPRRHPRGDGDAAARGARGRAPRIADELATWAACYPRRLPPGLEAPAATPGESASTGGAPSSERARRAEGRLPSGRSDLPRQFIVKSQRERIVDATAAIVARRAWRH